jgi:hypothetical protein
MKEQLDRIEAKLDKVIKAMQEYDGVDEDFNDPYDEYAQYKTPPCVGHDAASWDEELKEKVVNAAKGYGKKKAEETREYLKGATFNTIPDFQHTPPPPKPKKRYYKPKKKQDGNSKKGS